MTTAFPLRCLRFGDTSKGLSLAQTRVVMRAAAGVVAFSKARLKGLAPRWVKTQRVKHKPTPLNQSHHGSPCGLCDAIAFSLD